MQAKEKTVFERNLEQAFAASQYELALENRHKEDYRALRAQMEALFFRIKELLGENGRMMLELEAMTNQLGAMDNEAVYLQGFRDCVTLMKKSAHCKAGRRWYNEPNASNREEGKDGLQPRSAEGA